jgi:hypothetical protein
VNPPPPPPLGAAKAGRNHFNKCSDHIDRIYYRRRVSQAVTQEGKLQEVDLGLGTDAEHVCS